MKSSLFSNTHVDDLEKISDFQSNLKVHENDENSSFKKEMSLRLELLDQRKKMIFEQKLNEELSNEFSDDSAKKPNLEYIHIQDLIANSSRLSKERCFPKKNLNEQFKTLKKEVEILDFSDIITNQETLSFLKILKESCDSDEDFLVFEKFFYFLMREMGISLNYEEEEEKELFLALQDVLTTEDNMRISLNALEIFTKEKGILESVMNLVNEIKNNLKIRKSEEINKIAFEEINIIKSLLDEKNRELNEREEKLKEFEKELNQRDENLAELLQNFEQECERKLEIFFKEQLMQMNKRSTFTFIIILF